MLKGVLQRLARGFGYHISRLPKRRFDDMASALRQLWGFNLVVDCGANEGQWSTMASSIFPAVPFVLIEPQHCYAERLTRLCSERCWIFHECAVTERSSRLALVGSGTGARVAIGNDCAGRTLDELIPDPPSSVLLKLDVEGHELSALRGASKLLASTTAVIAETNFYDVCGDGLPVFLELANFLDKRGFLFYDLASLSGRARDSRLRSGDAIFISKHSPIATDVAWE